jgi:hypothetical protein
MVVYDAPNTEAGFIDLFYKAASDNTVDTLSVSWGESELWYFEAIAGVDLTGNLQAFHQAFGVDIASEVYPAGGGGGVSVYWKVGSSRATAARASSHRSSMASPRCSARSPALASAS